MQTSLPIWGRREKQVQLSIYITSCGMDHKCSIPRTAISHYRDYNGGDGMPIRYRSWDTTASEVGILQLQKLGYYSLIIEIHHMHACIKG